MKTLAALLLIPSSVFLFTTPASDNWDSIVGLTFAINLAVSSWMVDRSCRARPYSIDLVHRVFLYSFLVVAPLLQWRLGTLAYVANLRIDSKDIIRANALMLGWMTTYSLTHHYRLRKASAAGGLPATTGEGVRPVWAAIVGMAAILYLDARGMAGISTRGGLTTLVEYTSTTDQLLVTLFARAMPFAALGALVLAARNLGRRNQAIALGAAVAAGSWIVANPLAAARFWTAALAIAFACFTLLRRLRTGHALAFAILAGVAIGLPLLDLGRSAPRVSDVGDLTLPEWQDVAGSGDFDAYSMIIATYEYITNRGITWGSQLLGVALFWVPRVVWPGKPIGSGAEVAEFLRFENTNVSSPLQAEAIINFGIPGLVVFAFAFAALVVRLDNMYWVPSASRSPMAEMLYPFLVGMTFFVSRGDLLSGVAYVGAFVAAVAIVAADPLAALARRKVILRKGA